MLTLGVEIVLDVPDGVVVPDGGVAGDLLLLEAPLGQLLSRHRQHALEEVVVELDPGGHGLDHVAVAAAKDLNAPNVVGVALALLEKGDGTY